MESEEIYQVSLMHFKEEFFEFSIEKSKSLTSPYYDKDFKEKQK
jgi:hypothetical protein